MSQSFDVAYNVGTSIGICLNYLKKQATTLPQDAQITPFMGIIQVVSDPEKRGRVKISKINNPDVLINEWFNIPGFPSGVLPPEMIGKLCYCICIDGDINKTIILGLHGESNMTLPLKLAYVNSSTLPECNQEQLGSTVLCKELYSDIVYVCKRTNDTYMWTPISDVNVFTNDNLHTGNKAPGDNVLQTAPVPKNQLYFVQETSEYPAIPVYNTVSDKDGTNVVTRAINSGIIITDPDSRIRCSNNTVGVIALYRLKDSPNDIPIICAKKNGKPTWIRLSSGEQTMVFSSTSENKSSDKLSQIGTNQCTLDLRSAFDPNKQANSGTIKNPLDLTHFVTDKFFVEDIVDDYTRSAHLSTEQQTVVLRSILAKLIKAFTLCDNNITLIEYYLGIVMNSMTKTAGTMLEMNKNIDDIGQALQKTVSAYRIKNGGAAGEVMSLGVQSQTDAITRKPPMEEKYKQLELFTSDFMDKSNTNEQFLTGIQGSDELTNIPKLKEAISKMNQLKPQKLEENMSTELSNLELIYG